MSAFIVACRNRCFPWTYNRIWHQPRSLRAVVVVCCFIAVLLLVVCIHGHSRYSAVALCQASIRLDVVLRHQRRVIAHEMASLNASADWRRTLVLENGGEPMRNIIVTTWRSGSTFFNELLSNQPGNFDHYEPFHPYGPVNVDISADQHFAGVLRSILHCDYSRHIRPLYDTVLFNVNKHLNGLLPQNCFYSEMIEPICRLFPYQSMKLIRVRLRHADSILREYKNSRVFFLVRDPRATMHSRRDKDWCFSPTCYDPSSLCADLVDDYRAALTLAGKYPTRFHAVRYEDLVVDPRGFLRDAGMAVDERMEEFLKRHTGADEGGSYSTHRNSTLMRLRWRDVMDYRDVEKVQNVCGMAMKSWGYLPVKSAEELRTFVPVREWTLD